ncbi:hypothetical protein F5Y12DRAFT_741697 [Xylaria sp. FL1777]|nr:hypothetical protein F5Y12DRAFT_741697 [Xylaria sp. FL1777]
MSVTPPADMPDFVALGVHAKELALGISRCANVPAFNDPNISTKLDKLDEVTRNIDTLKQDLSESLTTSLTASLTASLTESLTASLTEVITRNINALSTNIAAREMNGFARTRNSGNIQPNHRLTPLYSVFTNAPIANFPKSVSQFKRLNRQTVMQILQELDDPFRLPNYGTSREKHQRLAMLVGVRLSEDPIVLRPSDAGGNDDDHTDDGDDGDDAGVADA